MANEAAAYIARATAQTAWNGRLREANVRTRDAETTRAIRAAASGKAHRGEAAYADASLSADRIHRRGERTASARTDPDLLDRRVLQPAAPQSVKPRCRVQGHGRR